MNQRLCFVFPNALYLRRMNHLAHCLLSFNDHGLLIGNFIGDDVKGHDWKRFPVPIQRGILLHRAIDSFTDHHPATDESVRRIRPLAGRYASPLVDILYDHLLCLRWDNFSAVSLADFAATTYEQLNQGKEHMNDALQERLPRMLAGHFLEGYNSREGLEWVLERFNQRIPVKYQPDVLADYFFNHLEQFLTDFDAFFPELVQHCQQKIASFHE